MPKRKEKLRCCRSLPKQVWAGVFFSVYLFWAVQGYAFVVDFETTNTGSDIFATPSIGVDQTVVNADNSGVDVTFNIDGDPSEFRQDTSPSPGIQDATFPGGGNFLFVDALFNTDSSEITFTITFTGTVDSATINLIDIDAGMFAGGEFTFQDEISSISASGTNVSGAVLDAAGGTPTSFADVTASGADAFVGGEVGFAPDGAIVGLQTAGVFGDNFGFENDALDTGNASITFTGTDIDQITFVYTPGDFSDPTPAPTFQRIGIQSVVFTVPEASTWITLAILVLLVSLRAAKRKFDRSRT